MERRSRFPWVAGACRLAGLLLAMACCGCEDIDWDWETQEWTAPRKSIRPSRPAAPTTRESSRPAVRRPPVADEPVSPPAEERRSNPPRTARQDTGLPPTEPPAPPRGYRSYYQLYLISGQSSLKTPQNVKKIVLQNGQSRVVTDLLHLIYPSIGPSGAEDQRFLVYQYELMWTAAAEFVHLLDCAEAAQPSPADPTDPVEAIRTGVGLLYHLNKPGQPTDFDRYKRVKRLMEVAMNSTQASGQARWGAAMLAGRVSAEILTQYGEARKYFELAQGYALPGSVEEMIAAYCVADTCHHEGQRHKAAVLAEALVKKFTVHKASYLYEQATEMAKPK